MNMNQILLSVPILCSLMAAAAVKAQKPVVIKGGEFCERYLLKKIAKDRAGGSHTVKLRGFNPGDETLSPGLKGWLRNMREDRLAAFELRSNKKKALVLRSVSYGATGLATSLECWHIEAEENLSITYLSFSNNPGLVYWGKDGRLNYYSVVYSDEFIHNKDWDNLTFDLERHRVNPDGTTQLVSEERNVKCE